MNENHDPFLDELTPQQREWRLKKISSTYFDDEDVIFHPAEESSSFEKFEKFSNVSNAI